MRLLTRDFFRYAITLGVVSACATSFAVVATTSTTDPGIADSFFRYVGQVNGASGVAVGPNLVLTARHVGSGSFTLDGTTYGVLSSENAPQYVIGPGNTTNVDLTLIRIDGTLPGWYNLGKAGSPAVNDAVTMVGYGRSGTVLTDGTGYNTGVAAGTRRAGGNGIDGFDVLDVNNGVVGGGPVMYSYLKGGGGSVLAAGDSGGGWFEGGNLVGISSFVFNDTDWSYKDNLGTHSGHAAPDYGFPRGTDLSYDTNGDGIADATLPAGTPYFGSGAIDLTSPQIQTWLESRGVQAVPEPTSLAVIGLGVLGILKRRKKA